MTASEEFELEVLPGPPLTVRVRGDLDLLTAPELRTCLDGLRTQGHERAVLDLAGVDFIDSQGLNALLQARADGLAISLRGANGAVRRLLQLTGVSEALPDEAP